MSILSNPKSLYGARIWQFGFALGVLVLVSYAGVHRGWWPNINGALAVGGECPARTLSTLRPSTSTTYHLQARVY